MNSRYINLFRFLFVCTDLVALSLVHVWLILNFKGVPTDNDRPYGLLFLVGNMVWLISAYGVGLYAEDSHSDVYHFIKKTVKAFLIFVSCMLMFVFLYHYPYSRLFILISFAGFFLLLFFTRLGMIGVSYFCEKG